MPTVRRLGSLRVTIYPNDHPPPHVHVIGGDGEAIFHLNCPDGPLALWESMGFKAPALRRMAEELMPHVAACCEEWDRIHGHP